MKKILYAALATVSGLVMLFSYRTSLEAVMPTSTDTAAGGASSGTADPGTSTSSGSGTSGSTSSGSGTSGSTSSGSGTSGSTSSGTTASSSLADGTYTGDSASTRYGPVQVQITVSGGQIAEVQVVEYPQSNGRDRQINENAIPRLTSETLSAQSADIDMVSGATYTSQGYLSSLQSAIDQAQS